MDNYLFSLLFLSAVFASKAFANEILWDLNEDLSHIPVGSTLYFSNQIEMPAGENWKSLQHPEFETQTNALTVDTYGFALAYTAPEAFPRIVEAYQPYTVIAVKADSEFSNQPQISGRTEIFGTIRNDCATRVLLESADKKAQFVLQSWRYLWIAGFNTSSTVQVNRVICRGGLNAAGPLRSLFPVLVQKAVLPPES